MTDQEDYIDKKSIEWLDGQDHCCSCHIVAPCSFCEGGFNLPLAEFIELALEWEYGDDYAHQPKPNTDYEDFDRAIKDLF